MNPIKQLFGQTAIYGLGIVLPRILNYILLTPFYTRIFEPSEYGIITELYAYVVFLLVILTYGMETGFFRFASEEKKNSVSIYKTILTSLLITSAFFLTAIRIFREEIANGLGYGDSTYLISWLSVIVAIDAFTAIPFAYIRLNNKVAKYALIRILEVLINIGFNLFFLLYCPNNEDKYLVQVLYNPDIGVGYVLISNLIASITKLALLSTEILKALKGVFDFTLLKRILKYSYPLLIAGLAGTINEALDRVLLKHLIPDQSNPMYQLGIYGANYKIAVLMTLYIQMFKYAAEPFFFSKSKDNNAKKLYADVMIFFMLPALMVFLFVTMYIDYFKLFIGEDFREGIGIVPVILLANLVMGIFFSLSIWYKLSNKTLYGALLVLIGALITIVVNVIYIPKFGYVASAWAHLIAYSVMVVLSYLFSRRNYKINYNLKRIFFYMFVTLIIFGLDYMLIDESNHVNNIFKFILLLITGIIFFFGERNNFKKYNTEVK